MKLSLPSPAPLLPFRSVVLAVLSGVIGAASHGVHAQGLPVRKAGLWEVVLKPRSNPGMQQRVLQCTDQHVDQVSLLSIVPGQEHCHSTKVRRIGKQVQISTTCWVHDNRVDAQIRLQGDFQSAYQGQFDVTYSKPVRFPPVPSEFSARWVGACQPGQRPADMVLPNGVTVNVVDDLKAHQAHDGHAH